VRRAEDYAALGARVVLELHSESHAAKPSTRVWAITRRGDRAHRRYLGREQRSEHRLADRASRPNRQLEERGMVADARRPHPSRPSLTVNSGSAAHLVAGGSSLLLYARSTPSARAWSAVLAGGRTDDSLLNVGANPRLTGAGDRPLLTVMSRCSPMLGARAVRMMQLEAYRLMAPA
jgi:hypothetical protein